MRGRWNSLVYGARLPLQALQLILRRPALLIWSVLPIIITLVLYFWLIRGAQEWINTQVLLQLISWGIDTGGWIATLLIWITRITLFVVGALTFSIAATLASSPFNDFLAESTERHALPPLPPAPGGGFTHKARLLWLDIAKSIISGVAGVVAIITSWVPVVNLFAFAMAFLLITFQYTSYPQTRRGVGITQGLWFIVRHSYACIGLGAVLAIGFSIPVLSALVLPVAVVSGTLLVARAETQPRLY